MSATGAATSNLPQRPARLPESVPPPLPEFDASRSDQASVTLSEHRTRLSTHRTALSEHRTALSEHRTDLSTYRTRLSIHRTDLSEQRTEMSMRRTGMSFQRTRLSAERTLMSVLRTALSLIGFGFTLYQVFSHAAKNGLIEAASHAPRNFGVALVALGLLMLTLGIVYHVQFMRGLRQERARMTQGRLIHGESKYPVSMTLIVAGLLWLLGVLAIASMAFNLDVFD